MLQSGRLLQCANRAGTGTLILTYTSIYLSDKTAAEKPTVAAAARGSSRNISQGRGS